MAAHFLFTDTRCPACHGRHTLQLPARVRETKGAAFQYTCPAAEVVVVFRPAGAPVLAVQLPTDAIPITRLPN